MNLDAYQTVFAEFLSTGELGRLPESFSAASNPKFLSIYRNGFYRACIEVLKSNFPTLVALLGEEYFSAIGRRYIDRYPPQQGSLLGYGETLPEHLLSLLNEADSKVEFAYLKDIARLDLAWLQLYFAPEVEAVTGDWINQQVTAGVDIMELQLNLVPSARLECLAFPVLDVWRELRDTGTIGQTMQLEAQPQNVLLWRQSDAQDAQIYSRDLNQGEMAFITALSDRTLGAAAAHAQAEDEGFELAETFAQLLNNQLLITI